MADRIAILGWGSLLWDKHPNFDALHGPWQYDGPILKIEFSRISSSRLGALTLVLDSTNGASNQVAYCLSLRSDLLQAVEGIRIREGTTPENIGYVHGNGNARSRDQGFLSVIAAWMGVKNFNCVIWTDLQSNFMGKTGEPFSVASATAYMQSLEETAQRVAQEYIEKAPQFIDTPLRRACAVC